MENKPEYLKIIRVKCDVWISLFIGLIVYCVADGECTRIYLRYGVSYQVTGLLKEIVEQINCRNFYKLGRSYFVNPDYFSELFGGAQGFTFSFGEHGEICPAPVDGVMSFIKLIEHCNKRNIFRGKILNSKEREKYLNDGAHEPKRNKKGRRRWLWEWSKATE